MEDRRLLAVSLQFDYSLDDTGFFSADRRSLLESTLNAIAVHLDDTLAAVPSYTYTVSTSVGDRSVTTSVPANTIKLYIFGDALGGSTAGLGGGNWSVNANNAMRGQGANDYAPNIGHIEFDDDGTTNWFFGATTSGLTGNLTDFVSVARHEFLHVLGFAQGQPTFDRFFQNSTFVGPNAEAAYGAPVPMNGSHVAASVESVMNASTLNGTREDLRPLEWGILQDLGWSVTGVASPPGFDRDWNLFTGGNGDGATTVKIDPSRGVYLMRVDVLAGDRLRLVTRDGASAGQQGVDSYLKLFDASGNLIANSNNSGAGNKEDFTKTFSVGGTYWVGVGTYAQRDFTFTNPSTVSAPSTAFFLDATLTGQTDAEPDSINGAATPIAFSLGTYTKQTTLAGVDSDYYRVDMTAGHTYTVSTAIPAAGGLSGPCIVTIYDATGRKVAGMDGSTPYGQVAFKAPASGRYYVLIKGTVGSSQAAPGASDPGGSTVVGDAYSSSYNRTGGGDYTLTITDAEPSLGPDPLFVDFGASGLWVWTMDAGYQQISPYDPENIVAQGSTVFMDFGAAGLWSWSPNSQGGATNGVFTKLIAADPQGMAAGVGNTLFVDFGPAGIWRYRSGGGFDQLIAADPEGITAAPDGSLFVDFGDYGLWRWTESNGFQQLTTANPEGIAVAHNGSNFDGWAYIDFGPSGLWRWSASSGFQQLIASNPESLAVGADNVLSIDFGPWGLWRWNVSGGFQKINTADAQGLAAGTDGFLYIDFGPSGLWRWSLASGYQQLHTLNADAIAIA